MCNYSQFSFWISFALLFPYSHKLCENAVIIIEDLGGRKAQVTIWPLESKFAPPPPPQKKKKKKEEEKEKKKTFYFVVKTCHHVCLALTREERKLFQVSLDSVSVLGCSYKLVGRIRPLKSQRRSVTTFLTQEQVCTRA